MISDFTVKCCYCDIIFDLTEDGNYPNELFDDGENVKRKCPKCGKDLVIKIGAAWHYSIDFYESNRLNEDSDLADNQ